MLSPEELQHLQDLKDIKPPLEVTDYSLFLLIILVSVGLVIVGTLVWFVVKYFRSRKKTNRRKELLKILRHLDYSDPKQCAYTVTKYGYELIRDENSENTFRQLQPKLEPYKYKKEVPQMDEETKQYIRHFIGLVRD